MARGWATRRAAVCLVLGIALVASVLEASEAVELTFRRLDRTYESLVDELAPIEIGPARVSLRSPEHSLRVLRHRATLAPAKSGGHDLSLEVTFAGSGRVEADVVLGSVASQLADDLVVPEQTLALQGRVAIVRAEDGYHITVLEAPPAATVKIQSRLAGRLVGLCRPMALVLVSLDCGALEQALASIDVPLPAAGAEYVLPMAEVDDDERLHLDQYLGQQPASAAPRR